VMRDKEVTHGRWLPGRARLATERWSALRQKLLDAGLLRVGERGDYLLTRDLHHYTLWQLCEQLQQYPTSITAPDALQPRWFATCQRLLDDVTAHGREQLAITLADLFTSARDPGERADNENAKS